MNHNVAVALLAVALSGCATMDQSPSNGIKSIGNDTFMVSDNSGFFCGNTIERASAYCSSFGQVLEVEANTTEKNRWTGEDHAVLVFRCLDRSPR